MMNSSTALGVRELYTDSLVLQPTRKVQGAFTSEGHHRDLNHLMFLYELSMGKRDGDGAENFSVTDLGSREVTAASDWL